MIHIESLTDGVWQEQHIDPCQLQLTAIIHGQVDGVSAEGVRRL